MRLWVQFYSLTLIWEMIQGRLSDSLASLSILSSIHMTVCLPEIFIADLTYFFQIFICLKNTIRRISKNSIFRFHFYKRSHTPESYYPSLTSKLIRLMAYSLSDRVSLLYFPPEFSKHLMVNVFKPTKSIH